jgi:TRAP-type C4-dicarboxylate transport system permease small subunit
MIADEFSAYLLVALTFLGAAYTWKERGHVRITALIGRLPPKVASWSRLIALILALIFVLVLSQSGRHFVAYSFRFHVSSASWLHTPLQVPHLTLLIGFILLALMVVVEIAKAVVSIRAGRSADEELAR